jgi:hypothetical protein
MPNTDSTYPNGGSRDPAKDMAMAQVASSPEYVEQGALMQSAINEDPKIKDPTNLSVYITREKGEVVIHLIGKAANELDKRRMAEIATEQRKPDQRIKDEVVVA